MLATTGSTFDLVRFSRAIEIGAIDYLTAQYAPDAQITIVGPDPPPARPRALRGTAAIKAWRQSLWIDYARHTVVKQLAAEDRLVFIEERVHYDGTSVVSTSTFELHGAFITAQHATEVWADERPT